MKTEYEVKELTSITGISKQAIHKKAKKENWQSRDIKKPKGGGRYKKYLTSSMGDEMIAKIAAAETQPAISPTPEEKAAGDTKTIQRKNALAKADLVRHYVAYLKKVGRGGKAAARAEFMEAYNSGLAHPEIFDALGAVAWKTIEQWKRQIRKKGDIMILADGRGYWKRGMRMVSDEQKKILLACALHPNQPKISEAIRRARAVMKTKGMGNGFSDATYRRFLENWKKNNSHIWTFTRQGAKAWNDTSAYYIERNYDLIRVGDIVVADGHKLNFEILNPWTGRPARMTLILWYDMKSSFPLGWELMPTENTQAIAAALRRAILRLGKTPQVAYLDNGKAFAARFFQGIDFEQQGFVGLFANLNIKTIFAWPYHAQSKTVERFFGIFAELERWCPTYVGTSIENKPPRMMRGEKLHRRVYEKVMNGGCVTLEMAHRAIAAWFDDYAARPQNGHLRGQRPVDVFEAGKGPGVDRAELIYLMMAEEKRQIRRNGVHFLGQNYYHPALYGRKHTAVIKYDLQDPSFLYVYDAHGRFICEASPVEKIHPAAAILGTEEDRERLKAHIALKKAQEKEAASLARAFLEDEVLPEHRRQLAAIGYEPAMTEQRKAKQPEKEYTPEEEAAIWAEAAAIECIDVEADALRRQLNNMDDGDRYEKLLELQAQGQLIAKHEQWQAFMTYFEGTPEYEEFKDYFNEKKAVYAFMYQQGSGSAQQEI